MADGRQKPWTIQSTLDWTVGYLENKGDEHPRRSAEWLLSDATGLSRVELYVFFDRPLSEDELARLHVSVKRRGEGEPLQYVTGEMPFRHIIVKTSKGVLIPRPETEVLVDVGLIAVDGACEERGSARVLDLCCGSGCIALSIAHERPLSSVVATDISAQAVALAEDNVIRLGLEDRVDVLECDLATGLEECDEGTFDLVISNPPYIPTAELAELPEEVSGFEPHLALDGGADGLDVFRRIVEIAPRLLVPGGMLACELFEDSLDEASSLCGAYHDVRITEDLAGRPRVISALL